jgi:hypothetical protein
MPDHLGASSPDFTARNWIRLVSDMCLPTLLPWFLLEAPDVAIAVDPLPYVRWPADQLQWTWYKYFMGIDDRGDSSRSRNRPDARDDLIRPRPGVNGTMC